MRYWILALLFVVTTLNDADRATLSITGTPIRKAFGIDPVTMGHIFPAFSRAYVPAQLPSGWRLDSSIELPIERRQRAASAMHTEPECLPRR